MRRSLRSQLPPPNALVAYEAAARHLNFTIAAVELGVTQGAVSRQIHILESFLGVNLFERSPAGVVLTEHGRGLYDTLSPALKQVAAKCAEFRQLSNSKVVTVSSTSGIATYWLLSRIAKLQSVYPAIDLRLLTSEPPVMPGDDGVDVTIRYGDGAWPGFTSTRLFGDMIFPVCSPAYARKHPINSSQDLLSATLLHRDLVYSHRWGNWEEWLQETGVSVEGPLGGPRFNNYALMIQSAIEGRGIAMGWGRLVEGLLKANLLVKVGELALDPGDGYFLLVADGAQLNRATIKFRDWILKHANA